MHATTAMKDLLHFRPFRSDKDKVCVPGQKDCLPKDDLGPGASTVIPTAPAPPMSTSHNPNPLTVVELFQSQGCSSCPPANNNVIALVDDPDKLVLTYEVTYWDYLGWPDTFGNKAWDQRQWEYAHALKNKNVYTPQVSRALTSLNTVPSQISRSL